MFKGRLGIWITVLVLCISIPWLVENVPQWLKNENVSFASELETNEFAESISNVQFGHVTVVQQNESPDIIFSHTSEHRSGYSVYKDALYSPLVLYVRQQVHSSDAGFGKIDGRQYYRNIDLRSVLIAIETNSQWSDLGISSHVLQGTVQLHIPAEHVWYYNEVVELFYLTLNDYKMPSEEEKIALQPRVDNILSKCIKVNSLAQELADNYNNTQRAYIAPEYCYQNYEGMGVNSSATCVPVYFHKTINVHANIYVHNTQNALNTNEFLSTIKAKTRFMSYSGWRVKDATYDVTSVSGCYAKNP